MKKLSALLLFVAVVVSALSRPAQALTMIEITGEEALTTIQEITVTGGHSVVIDMRNGAYIQSIWIDDPTILGIATNRPLCSAQINNGCGNATAMRLTKLDGSIDLPGSSFRQATGLATLLTVNTTNINGQNSVPYQFVITTTSSARSDVSMVIIGPDVPRETGTALEQLRTSYDIESIKIGRDRAISDGIADTESKAWSDLEEFIALMDEGKNIINAIGSSGVSRALLAELESMGRYSRT